MNRLWAKVIQDADNINAPYPTSNPLTKTGKKVMRSMVKQYGKKRGKRIFYSSIQAKKKGSRKWHK